MFYTASAITAIWNLADRALLDSIRYSAEADQAEQARDWRGADIRSGFRAEHRAALLAYTLSAWAMERALDADADEAEYDARYPG